MSLDPKTRVEYFLDGIVNDHSVYTPKARVEVFLADIKAGNVARLTPETRIELFLAKISGANVEIPDPETRIELFLAKIAGEDMEVPEPVSRIEYWLAQWAEQSGGIEKTVTGNPIHITDALAKPVQALSIALEPVQAGSGDPSPDNVRPISGHTDADVWDDPKYGGLINWNQLRIDDYTTFTRDGITTSYDTTTHLFCITNNSRTSNYISGSTQGGVYNASVPVGHKVLNLSNSEIGVGMVMMSGGSQVHYIKPNEICTVASSNTHISLRVTSSYDFVTSHPVNSNYYFYANIFDLTEMFGAGNEPSTAAAFKALFSKDYYAYSPTPVETCVSAVNGDPYRHYPIPLGTTVYGGTAEWIGGDKWRVTSYPYYASYNGETLVGPWISSMDKYEAGATPTTGAQVVDFGGTPTIFTITTTELFSLLQGENNLWSDGKMTLVYLADGNASEIEALNILLGGRYVNNHEADEPTDREALDILLGGTR